MESLLVVQVLLLCCQVALATFYFLVRKDTVSTFEKCKELVKIIAEDHSEHAKALASQAQKIEDVSNRMAAQAMFKR